MKSSVLAFCYVSVLGKPVMFLAPESNGFMKKLYRVLGLVSWEGSLIRTRYILLCFD